MSEIKKAVHFGKHFKMPAAGELFSEEMMQHANRWARGQYFLQLARSLPDLGMKVAVYASVFECLFATSNSELKNKLAQHAAVFLSDDPQERKRLHAGVNEAYNIRSRVIHGDILSAKQLSRLQEVSVFCDEVLRSAFRHIFHTKDLHAFYFEAPASSSRAEKMNRELDEYFLNRLLFNA